MKRSLWLAVLAGIALTLGLLSPAHAAVSAQVSGTRIAVTISGKQPKKAALILDGKRYPLKRSGKTWRTKPLSPETLNAAGGKRVRVKQQFRGKKKTAKTTIPANPGEGGGGGGGGGGGTVLFPAPGVDREGSEAWEAVKGYFADSTMTDCPAGWPNCAVEYRFSVANDSTHWFCRLTNSAGSDIRSVGRVLSILGAAQKADGSWGVSFQLDSYGNTTTYTHFVNANGIGYVQYWGPGIDPNVNPPSEEYPNLTWIRGAKDCSY